MTRAYYLNDGDEPIEMQNELSSSLIPPALMERDIVLKAQTGRIFAYKRSSRRRYSLDYTFGPGGKDFFETQHKAVDGIVRPFFFMEDSADPDTAVFVRKQQDFRPKKIAPGIVDGVFGPRWSYTLDLIEVPNRAGSVASGTIGAFRGRPTYIEEYEDEPPVNPLRSRIIDGTLAADVDASALTYAETQFDSSRSTAFGYASLLLSAFPAPPGPIASATLHVITEYLTGDTGSGAYGGLAYFSIFNARNPNPVGAGGFVDNFIADIDAYIGNTANVAKAEHTYFIDAAHWASDFSSDASNIWLRACQYDTLNYDLVTGSKYRIYDCWIDYVLA